MFCGPAGLAVFSCGIRLTPLEAVTDSCTLSVYARPSGHRSLDYSVTIGPTSVSYCKWMLYCTPSVYARIPFIFSEIFLIQISGLVLKGPSFIPECPQFQERSTQRWTGEWQTRLLLGGNSGIEWK